MSNSGSKQTRNVKPSGSNSNSYSNSPSQLTLSSDTPSIIPPSQYQPFPFAQHDPNSFFPEPAHPYRHPPQLAHQLPPPNQPSLPPHPASNLTRKRRASDADHTQAGNNAGYAIPQHVDHGNVPHDVNLGQQIPPHHQQPGAHQHAQAPLPTQPQQPGAGPSALIPNPATKKGRTNTPWTPAEEQRLKALRDKGSTWSDIAKTFPHRTEGSVKKHWYKDMHYAEFATDESAALLQAIREYDGNKWKVIGQKLGKPAKACETFAKDQGWKI